MALFATNGLLIIHRQLLLTNMEDYAAKMQLKSDAALRDYVTGYAQYRDEAVLAALAELRHRGQPATEEAHLRPLLEAAVQQQAAVAAATPAATSEAAEEQLPQLYSPSSIAIVSAAGSVLVGAVLLALNMRRQGQGRAIVGLVVLVLGYLVLESLAVRWLLTQQLASPLAVLLLDLPIILLFVWWFWPRYVRTHRFQPRSWLVPLAVSLFLRFGLPSLLLLNPTVRQALEQQIQQLQPPK